MFRGKLGVDTKTNNFTTLDFSIGTEVFHIPIRKDIMFAWSEFEKITEEAALVVIPVAQPLRKSREALKEAVVKLKSHAKGKVSNVPAKAGKVRGSGVSHLPWSEVDEKEPAKKSVVKRAVRGKAKGH